MYSHSAADYQVYMGGIDVRIERWLWHLEGEPKKDVAADLCAEFEFEELMIVRDSLFERAIYMAERRADIKDEGPSQRDGNGTYAGLCNPWEMIKRRVIGPASMDVCELYLYMVNSESSFPTKILRRTTIAPKGGFNMAEACDLSKISEKDEDGSVMGQLNGKVSDDNDNKEIEVRMQTSDEDMMDPMPDETEHEGGDEGDREDGGNEDDLRQPDDERRDENEGCRAELKYPGTKRVEDVHIGVTIGDQGCINNVGNGEMDGDIVNNQSGICKEVYDEQILLVDEDKVVKNAQNDVKGMMEVGITHDERYGDGNVETNGETEYMSNDIDDVWDEPEYCEGRCEVQMYNMFDEPPSFDDTMALIKVLIGDEIGNNNAKQIVNECGAEAECDVEMTPDMIVAGKTNNRNRGKESETPSNDTSLLACQSSNEVHTKITVPQNKPCVINIERETVKKGDSQPIVSLPAPTTRVPTQNTKGVDMATQTTPNVIPDGPVTQTEFRSQMDYVEQALTDHERRMRMVEMSRNKNDRKVDRIDADYFNQNQHVLGIQAAINNEVRALRGRLEEVMITVNQLQGANGMEAGNDAVPAQRDEGAKADGGEAKGRAGPVQNGERDSAGRPQDMQRSTRGPAKEPQPRADLSNGGQQDTKPPQQQRRVGREKAASSYESFMRAAAKAVPVAASMLDFPCISGGASNATPKPQRIANRSTTRKRLENGDVDAKGRRDGENERGANANVTTSTPKPAAQAMNFSWADDEKEDSKTIEKFLAVENEKVETGEGSAKPNRMGDKGKKNVGQPEGARRVSFVESADDRAENYNPNKSNDESSYDDEFPQLENGEGLKRFDGTVCGAAPILDGGRQQRQRRPKEMGAAGGVSATAHVDNSEARPQGRNANRGARPKTYQRGNGPARGVNTTERERAAGRPEPQIEMNDADTSEERHERESYAGVASKNPWLTQGRNKKRKMDKRSPKALPPLQGIVAKPQRDIFVRGLATTGYSSKKEMAEAIRLYCEERGVAVLYARIMVNSSEPGVANVKITVHEEDLETIIDPDFWPAESTVREWFNNGRERRSSNAAFEGRDMSRGNGNGDGNA